MFVTYGHLCDLTAALNGVVISMPGFDDYDEVRIACVDNSGGYGDSYLANYVCHKADGGFVYGGEEGCHYGAEPDNTWSKAFWQVFGIEDDLTCDSEIEIFEMRDIEDGYIDEIEYGHGVWNAFEEGHEVR